jgi:hypothetical protein
MALNKHWKKFFPLLTAIITNTAISRSRHFCDIELERFNRKTLQVIHNVVGSVSGCEVTSLSKSGFFGSLNLPQRNHEAFKVFSIDEQNLLLQRVTPLPQNLFIRSLFLPKPK